MKLMHWKSSLAFFSSVILPIIQEAALHSKGKPGIAGSSNPGNQSLLLKKQKLSPQEWFILTGGKRN
jgi:hypothetical protein